MLKKTRSGADKVKVTFVLPSQPNADHVHVVGDFNHWQASTPMKRDKEGRWRATVELEPGREYQFRYLVDGNEWVNDEAADRYDPNPFGADNCVLTTPAGDGSAGRASRAESAGASKRSVAGGTRSSAGTTKGGKSADKEQSGSKAGGKASGSRTSPRRGE